MWTSCVIQNECIPDISRGDYHIDRNDAPIDRIIAVQKKEYPLQNHKDFTAALFMYKYGVISVNGHRQMGKLLTCH